VPAGAASSGTQNDQEEISLPLVYYHLLLGKPYPKGQTFSTQHNAQTEKPVSYFPDIPAYQEGKKLCPLLNGAELINGSLKFMSQTTGRHTKAIVYLSRIDISN